MGGECSSEATYIYYGSRLRWSCGVFFGEKFDLNGGSVGRLPFPVPPRFTGAVSVTRRILMHVIPALDHLVDLAASYLLSLPIGWEREQAERSAGIRTFPLVAVASCAFVLATETAVKDVPEARSRIIEGVITGMGFIGGGAILKTEGAVRGTATAASLWATGAIGIACAGKTYDVAIIVSAMTFLTLRILVPLKSGLDTDKT
jgi:putative Mg2+ transporter-C (MgtC) family protein